MRHHQRGPALHQPVERILHRPLAFGIERRSRFVEQQDRRVLQDRPCDGEALALAARKRHAALADNSLIAIRQGADELVRRCEPGCGLDLLLRGVGPAIGDVVAHRDAEHRRLLRHQRETLAPDLGIGLGPRNAVHDDAPILRIVETQRQLQHRALAGA